VPVSGNDDVIVRFYEAFAARDGDKMAACYADDARFSDPVFQGLTGKEPGQMWRMLTSNPDSDLKVELLDHAADGDTGTAHWQATYTFPDTGRKVLNDVQASLHFENGKIADHVDKFDFHKWAGQALGLPGKLLGGTPIIKGATRRKARARLDKFIAGDS
jgi:ketosteroid isomerase-like protein